MSIYKLGHLRHSAVEIRLGNVLLLFFKETLIGAREVDSKEVFFNEVTANANSISRRSIHQWCSITQYTHKWVSDEYFETLVFDLISTHFNSRRAVHVESA